MASAGEAPVRADLTVAGDKSDSSTPEAPSPRNMNRRTRPKRAASKNVNYCQDSDSMSCSSDEPSSDTSLEATQGKGGLTAGRGKRHGAGRRKLKSLRVKGSKVGGRRVDTRKADSRKAAGSQEVAATADGSNGYSGGEESGTEGESDDEMCEVSSVEDFTEDLSSDTTEENENNETDKNHHWRNFEWDPETKSFRFINEDATEKNLDKISSVTDYKKVNPQQAKSFKISFDKGR